MSQDELKKCRYCNEIRPAMSFGVALTTPTKIYRRHKCSVCYLKAKQVVRDGHRKRFNSIKEERVCHDCGIKDKRVLDFHHKKGSNKEFAISSFVEGGCGVERILKEIEKCVVLCANCHRIRHYEEKRSYSRFSRLA